MHEGVLELGALGCDEAHRFDQILLPHGRLEVGGGLVLGFGLALAPFHEEAIGQATQHPHDPLAIGSAHPTAVVVQGDIQPEVEPGFDSPALAVGAQPLSGSEFFGRATGHQRDALVLATGMLAHQAGRLGRKGKAEVFGRHGPGFNGATLPAAFVALHRARTGRRRHQRGKNPLRARESWFRCGAAGWADWL